jgi:hypothetical protein
MAHQMAEPAYWMYQWIDEEGIRREADIRKVLRRPQATNHLLELQNSSPPVTYITEAPGQSVVAGRRVDLSGFLDCSHFECLLPQIDRLFAGTWHYFDSIVVDDLELRWDRSHPDELADNIEQRTRLLLHLRKIGASGHVSFKRKLSGFCQLHFREFAEQNDLGLDLLFDEAFADRVTNELVTSGRFEIFPHDDGSWHYAIHHPKVGRINGTYSHSDPEVRPSREEVARDAFGLCCSGLISDVAATRDLGLPLLQVAEGLLLSESEEDAEDDIVALSLRLPVLRNVSAKEILRLKHDNWPEFERFRSALRVAIKEQIDRAGTKSPEEIARAVLEEYVNPELADIERHLATARKGLALKIGAGVTLGGATVAAGAIATVPLVMATGVAAIATSLPQVYKHFEDRRDVEMSDLYFLWKARIKETRGTGHR